MADTIARVRPAPVRVAAERPRARKRPVGVPGGALMLAVVSLMSLGRAPAAVSSELATPRAAPFAQIWVGTARTAATLAAIDPAATEVFLGASTSATLGGFGGSMLAAGWASEAQFAADLTAGRVPPDVRIAMYDPEGWEATPLDERVDPVAAMRAFATLAHRHGLLAMITPHPNLVAVPGATCREHVGETQTAAFLRCGITAEAARFADVVEVQAQSLEADPAAYAAFVTEAAVQARAANPGVLVLSGLSTNFTSDPGVLYRAWTSVRSVVDGHYLNVPLGVRPAVATTFLRMLARTATGAGGPGPNAATPPRPIAPPSWTTPGWVAAR
jgi:hypothetical protein